MKAQLQEPTLFPNNYNCVFNPVEEWKLAVEEIKKLYERLLESEKEKIELLKRLLP